MDRPRIVDFSPDCEAAFRQLNLEWLEKYFVVEDIDRRTLARPRQIIEQGGAILFARLGNDVVGTVALKYQGDGVYELTKMAVTADHQGAGIGRALMGAALERYDQLGGKTLYLETNSRLTPAIRLYESAGFVREPHPAPSDYARSDTYMVYRLG